MRPETGFFRRIGCLAATFCLLMLAACESDAARLTLIAEHDLVGTDIGNLRITATVIAARAQTTLDYVGTQVRFREDQSVFLQSTLIARGTPAAFIAESLPSGAIVLPTATGSPIPTPAPLTTEDPVPEELRPRLENVVMTTGVDRLGCPLASTGEFYTDSTEIYAAGIGRNLPAGAIITSRWRRVGEVIAVYDYAPPTAVTQECIWFFIDQTDAPFTPGEWSVTLELGGVEVTTLNFVIRQR